MSCIVKSCEKDATQACDHCDMVLYCGNACAEHDWKQYHANEHHIALCIGEEEEALSYDSELSSIEMSIDESVPTLQSIFETPTELIEARRRRAKRRKPRGRGRRKGRRRRRKPRRKKKPTRRRRRKRKTRKWMSTAFTNKARTHDLSPSQFHVIILSSPEEYTRWTQLQAKLYKMLH